MSSLGPQMHGISPASNPSSVFQNMADEGEVMQTIKCFYCDQDGKIMKLCTRCRAIIYCSKECQLKDWPDHKKKCAKTKSRSERNTMNKTLSRDEIMKEKEKKYTSENHNYASTADIDDSKEDFKHCITNGEQIYQRKQAVKCSQISKRKDRTPVDREICRSSSSKKDMGEVLMLHTRELNNTKNGDLNHLLIKTKKVFHSNDTITIYIKHSKEKKSLEIMKTEPEESDSAFLQISAFLRIPVTKLKLIHKGKMVTAENVNTFLNHGALFLAFGEVCECEDGLDKNKIDILMKQLNVDRNVAVKALRKTGTLLDAVFDIGNRL